MAVSASPSWVIANKSWCDYCRINCTNRIERGRMKNWCSSVDDSSLQLIPLAIKPTTLRSNPS